jgi:ATP synthase protein I
MMHLRYTSAASQGAGSAEKNMLGRLRKPVLTVLRWQLAATAALILISWIVAGGHGAASALIGGLIGIAAGIAAALVAAVGGAQSAGGLVMAALRAEAVKVGLAALLLWLVLVSYDAAVVGALIASFIVTLLIFAMAFFVRDY